MTDGMQVQVTRHYAENRGDHASDSIQAYTYDPDETVADLLMRVMEFPVSRWRSPDHSSFVILRVVSGTEPTEPKEASDVLHPF